MLPLCARRGGSFQDSIAIRACRAYHGGMATTGTYMTMEDILAMPSADAEAELAYREAGSGNRHGIEVTGSTVADVLPVKEADIKADPVYYGALRASMMKGQTVPLGSFNGCMLNGLHRVAIALALGWEGMIVGEDFEGSTDEAFDSQHERMLLPSMPVAA